MNAHLKAFAPIDDLESELIASLRSVSQATHRFLVLLREFDLRRGWEAYGNTDCADWLDWRCGISRTTAQEKVRVARALWSLPQIEEAFRRGDLSYSKVRALTRVATEVRETELLDFALGASAAQVEAYCRRLRNGDADLSLQDARRLHEGRSLTRHLREDGSGMLTAELPAAEIELVMQALDRIAATLPEDREATLFAKGADALVAMARLVLAGFEGDGSGGREVAASSDAYQVVVHVDAAALEGRGGSADLPLPAVRRLCCDGAVVPLVERDGQPLGVGRRQRVLTVALRRALRARDRNCAFPGCHHERFLDAHHIHHWADGGETALDNLLLLCTHHHKLVHEGGFAVRRERDGAVYFVRPDGRPVVVEDLRRRDEVSDVGAVYRLRPPSAEGGMSADAAASIGDAPSAEGGAARWCLRRDSSDRRRNRSGRPIG